MSQRRRVQWTRFHTQLRKDKDGGSHSAHSALSKAGPAEGKGPNRAGSSQNRSAPWGGLTPADTAGRRRETDQKLAKPGPRVRERGAGELRELVKAGQEYGHFP